MPQTLWRSNEVAPSASATGTARPESKPWWGGSIYPWLFAIPLVVSLFVIIIGSFIELRDESTMRDSIAAVHSFAFTVFMINLAPMFCMLWFVSSTFDVAFNGLVPWPRAQTFYLAAIQVWCLVWMLYIFGISPLLHPEVLKHIGILIFWAFCVMALCLIPAAFSHVLHNLREAVYKRAGGDEAKMKEHLKRILPVCSFVLFVQFCTCVGAVAHAMTFPTIPSWPDGGRLAQMCHNVNASFVRKYCSEGPFAFDFTNRQSYRAGSGHGALACREDPWKQDIDPYKSLFFACRSADSFFQLLLSGCMAAPSLFLLMAVIFREQLTSIDDQLNRWNWISRARSWEAANSKRGASYSAVRIISAIVLASYGLLGSVMTSIVLVVAIVMRGSSIISLAATLLLWSVLLAWASAFFLLMIQFRHRRRYQNEESPEALEEKKRVQQIVDGEEQRRVCKFWFLSAQFVKQYEETTLPRFQELQNDLISIDVPFADALSGKLNQKGEICIVSHRWMASGAPDEDGTQLHAIKQHLHKHPNIKYLWFDYWCMPQGYKTPGEQISFKWMLSNINVLYLSVNVLILLDLSYFSRFWTQYEAWLSMQTATKDGLQPAAEEEKRHTIVPIYNTNESLVTGLEAIWAKVTPALALAMLSKPDVTVTNESDKTEQLPKILQLDRTVRDIFMDQLTPLTDDP